MEVGVQQGPGLNLFLTLVCIYVDKCHFRWVFGQDFWILDYSVVSYSGQPASSPKSFPDDEAQHPSS